MERVTAVFYFSEAYSGINFREEKATVQLEVDYLSKRFSIKPAWRSGGDGKFEFKDNSKEYKKWIAVLSCMQKAIEFGNQEIGVTARPSGQVC